MVKVKSGYCPICDKEITIYSNDSIHYCPTCRHHISFHEVDLVLEIEELKADNERLRNMWADVMSKLSKLQAENVQYKRMLDNAYEIIGKITDRCG